MHESSPGGQPYESLMKKGLLVSSKMMLSSPELRGHMIGTPSFSVRHVLVFLERG